MPRSASASGSERVAPLKAPAKMPISVMPIWTVERNPVGSSPRRMARSAPRLPALAMVSSRARRADTVASSDMAKKPFSTISTRTITIDQIIRLPIQPRCPIHRGRSRRVHPSASGADVRGAERLLAAPLAGGGGGFHRRNRGRAAARGGVQGAAVAVLPGWHVGLHILSQPYAETACRVRRAASSACTRSPVSILASLKTRTAGRQPADGVSSPCGGQGGNDGRQSLRICRLHCRRVPRRRPVRGAGAPRRERCPPRLLEAAQSRDPGLPVSGTRKRLVPASDSLRGAVGSWSGAGYRLRSAVGISRSWIQTSAQLRTSPPAASVRCMKPCVASSVWKVRTLKTPLST